MQNLGTENESLEFKKTTSERKAACDDIAAILNKKGSGTLYFGVWPNGDAKGLMASASTLNDVAEAIKTNIRPMIYPSIEKVTIDGADLIKVLFSGTEIPYSSHGHYYKRVHDRTEEMTPHELRSILNSTDYTSEWENNPSLESFNDVDHEALKSFYDTAVGCGRLAPMEKYDEVELLRGLGLASKERLTNAGRMLFSKKGPVSLKAAVYLTDERINFADIKRYSGNIYNLVNTAVNYIRTNIRWRVEGNEGVQRMEIPEIPMDAVREIVVNAFAHADYRGDTEHEIDITPTLVEIYSPGPFPMNLTPEDFVSEQRKSIERNHVILNMLFKCKYVEMFGSGFKKVFHLCEQAGVKTSSKSDPLGFSFFFYRPELRDVTDDVTVYVTDESPLKALDIRILMALKENPTLTREQLAKTFQKNIRTVQRSLNNLKQAKKIRRIGTDRTGYWEVLN